MPKALIIDDNDVMRNAVRLMLENIRFELYEAEDGFEGLQLLKKNKYDIVLLDIRMPKIDGEQVITILKKRHEMCPIIVISAYLTQDQLIKFAKLGVKGFLSKPIDIQKFYQEINKICPIEIPKM